MIAAGVPVVPGTEQPLQSGNISDELLAFMVSKDAGETKKAVDSFVELFNAAVNEAVKGKARQETPKDGGGFSASKASLGIGDMAREARIIK